MLFLLANTVFLILSIGYAWLAGSRLDRQAIVWIVAALAGTLAVQLSLAGHEAIGWVLAIDMALLAVFIPIALRSPRYWPTWFAALHLAGVTCGVVAILAPLEYRDILRVLAGFWGTPALLVMVYGLFLDRRAEAGGQPHPST